jgi:hypothetical protein
MASSTRLRVIATVSRGSAPPASDHQEVRYVANLARKANADTGATVDLVVDHTAPSPPDNVGFDSYDATTHDAVLSWDNGDDPDLPGGVPGAGVANAQYRVLDGGAWTAWQDNSDGDARIGGVPTSAAS